MPNTETAGNVIDSDKLRDLVLSACTDLGFHGLKATPDAIAAVASLIVNASNLRASVDTDRLDWLTETAATVLPIFNQAPDEDDDEAWHVRAEDSACGEARGATLRSTIDAARDAGRARGEG